MSVDADRLFEQMLTAGATAFGAGWGQAETFAKLEFRTLAVRIESIGSGLERGDFDLPTGKMLLAMQVNTAIAAIAGATTLVMLAVEAAINAMLEALREGINAALGVALL